MENFEGSNDELFISNSGLTIIAVYLPRFFDELKMLETGQFINDEAANRATLLTQYIISGESAFQDHELLLNKIICGLEIESPVSESIEITSEEAELSESLLYGVISNWDKIKNTSFENLRGSFLLRSGRISESDQAWILDVESKGFDLLLDTLPWYIGYINLPWMVKPLQVNWR